MESSKAVVNQKLINRMQVGGILVNVLPKNVQLMDVGAFTFDTDNALF